MNNLPQHHQSILVPWGLPVLLKMIEGIPYIKMEEVMKYQLSHQDYLQGLHDSINQLQFLASAYDQGAQWAYRPMANIHRLLFRSTRLTHSLISRLDLEDILMFDSAPEYRPENLIAHNGLGFIGMTGGTGEMEIHPRLNNSAHSGKWVDRERWWEGIVYSDYAKATMSRRDFVLNVCEQDIGSHADKELDNPAYSRLSRHWFGQEGENEPVTSFPILGCEKAYMRQITFEVLLSFQRQGLS